MANSVDERTLQAITPSGIEILARAYQRTLTERDLVEGGLDSYVADYLSQIKLLEKTPGRIPIVGRPSWTITEKGREYFATILEYAEKIRPQ